MANLDGQAIPPVLRLGLPPAMAAADGPLYWGVESAPGPPQLPGSLAHREEMPAPARQLLERSTAPGIGVSARQAMAQVRKLELPTGVPDPSWCMESVPGTSNCYTDGSHQAPTDAGMAPWRVWGMVARTVRGGQPPD